MPNDSAFARDSKAERALADEVPARTRTWRRSLRRWTKNRVVVFGTIMLLLIAAAAIIAPALATHDPGRINPADRLQAPSAEHWLGTDHLGRDQWSRILFGARLSLLVGAVTTVVVTVVGIVVGLLSGFYRRLDNAIMRFMDGLMAFPSILLALAIIASLGPGLWNIVLALALVNLPRIARVVRGEVLVLRETAYVESARGLGGGDVRIMFKHMLPNAFGPILVTAAFIFAYAILAEASLSFLGVGSSPEQPSWGNMLSVAQTYLRQAPWLLAPGFAIVFATISLNLLGDGMRDIFDPNLTAEG